MIIKKKRGVLSDNDFKEIIRLYSQGEVSSTHRLGEMFNVGHKKISNILKDNDVIINKKGGQEKIIKKKKIEIKLPIKYIDSDTTTYKAICVMDNIEFDDYNNESGVLTRHLKNKYPHIPIPKYRGKQKYFLKTNNYWYEQYFNIVVIEKKPIRKCDYCDFEMPINVSTRQYRMHLTMKHNITAKEHLLKFPKDKELFKDDFNRLQDESCEDKYVICKICGVKMKILSNKHLSTHNITKFEYRNKFGNTMCKQYETSIRDRMFELNSKNIMYVKSSSSELELLNFIKDLGFNGESNRSILNGKEIDILIEDKKVGIEFNGNKWHTEWFGGKDKNNHVNKTILANNKGYGLIQIFEDEWVYNKELVLNKIKHILGKNDINTPKIGARKTNIIEINKYVSDTFLENNHIQGNVSASTYLGCYYSGELIAVMTFKKLDNNSNYDLTRFATNNNYICQGVASKMLKYFINNFNPYSIVSFADRRWTLNKDNNLYTKLGFSLISESKPDYRYYNEKHDRYARFHKFNFRKNILHKKYGLPIDMTETEMVRKLGYDRIWDCGLFKYKLIIKNDL